jgi:hypothetical protein
MAKEGKLPDRYAYPIQVWQFGRGFKLIAMGGEVVVDYSLRLKRENGWNDTSPNTVHLTIMIRLEKSIRRVRWRLRGRRG